MCQTRLVHIVCIILSIFIFNLAKLSTSEYSLAMLRPCLGSRKRCALCFQCRPFSSSKPCRVRQERNRRDVPITGTKTSIDFSGERRWLAPSSPKRSATSPRQPLSAGVSLRESIREYKTKTRLYIPMRGTLTRDPRPASSCLTRPRGIVPSFAWWPGHSAIW